MQSLEQQLVVGTNDNDNSVGKSDGDGKMKGITSHTDAPSFRDNFSVAVPARTNELDEKVEANKYKFSKPWSINDIRKVIVPPESKSLDAVGNKRQISNELIVWSITVNKERFSKESEAAPVKPLSPLSTLVKPHSGWKWYASNPCAGPTASGATPTPAPTPDYFQWRCPASTPKIGPDTQPSGRPGIAARKIRRARRRMR